MTLRGGFLFDAAGLLALAIVERSAEGMPRLSRFIDGGLLDGLEGRDVPPIALTPARPPPSD